MQATPGEVGVDLANWNWKAMRQFVAACCGVRLCRSACTRDLRRQFQRGKTFAPTKGKHNRRLDLSALELAALRAHRALQDEDKASYGAAYEDHSLIFCTHRGWPLGWRTVDRDFARRMRRAGVRVITFHESRHTCATIALKHGIPAKVVQERLGHSDIGVTLNIYSHVTPGLGRRAAAQMGAILVPDVADARGAEPPEHQK